MGEEQLEVIAGTAPAEAGSVASGLSGVHINRVMQQLRGAGLVSTAHGRLNILDWPGLVQAGDFDPAYLHLHWGSATLLLEPIRVANGADEEGMLVLCEGRLVAILVKLTQQHGEAAGRWFLETAYGHRMQDSGRSFADLREAKQWIETRICPPP